MERAIKGRNRYTLQPVASSVGIDDPEDAPRQGYEGAPDAWIEIDAPFADALRRIDGLRLKVGPIEAIDGRPVIDIKVALDKVADP